MTAQDLASAAPPAARPVQPRRARPPFVLIPLSAGVALALAVPLVFLLIEASGAGLSHVIDLIARPLTAELLWNTVRLTVAVTVLCAIIGTGAAWLVERTTLPGRRIWAVLLVVPLAIPDFVVSFGWASLWTWVHGFRGAVLVMTLAVYPLVYLPVAGSLRSADPVQEEVARSLGTSRLRTFFRITVGQARGAILGGCLLVALVLLAEYGAFELLGYQTFTTEIFTEFNLSFSVTAACALSLVLVGLSLLVLGGEGLARGRGRGGRGGAGPAGVPPAAGAGPGHLARPGRHGRAGRRGPGRPGVLEHLLGLRGRHPVRERRQRLHARCPGPHRRLRRRDRRPGHPGRAAGGPAGHPAHQPRPALPGAQHLPGAGHARRGDRLRPGLLHRALRGGRGLPDGPAADRLLRDHVLPARAGRGEGGRGPRAGRPGRGGPLPGPEPGRHPAPGHPPAGGPGAGGLGSPGVPVGGDRAHRHAAADPDRRADPGHAVLAVRDRRLVRAGRPVRHRHDPDRRRAQLRARPVLRPVGACAM